ncbi:MAG: hypothetical protein HY928_07325 [Elusimicrobia bacterium]|nr:hypothetical protein [Elusimicrobiota bacterium]
MLLAALFGAGCAGHRPGPARTLSVTQSWVCPLPPHRGLLVIDPDGKASLSIFEGLDVPGAMRSERRKKRLPPEDMGALAEAVAKSGYRSMPDRAESFPPRYDQTDPCSRSLEVSEGGKTKRISFHDGDVPDDLARLVQAIDRILDKTAWEPDVYPWEGTGGDDGRP